MGSHLCERLLAEGYRVVCTDNLRTGSLENVAHLEDESHFEYIDHDVTSHINVGRELDEIYHFASPASPKDFGRIPIPILKAGALGTYNSLGLALAKGTRLMLASSSEVYGDPLVHLRGRTMGARSTQWECAAFMMRPSATPRRSLWSTIGTIRWTPV